MSRSEATILHADVDAFFAAVEQRDDPGLRGRPIAVGPGVVMAASYEARAHGVRGGMAAERARRLCPQITFVAPRFDAYTQASAAVFAVFREFSPVVEGLGLEEAFLDVRGLERIRGTPEEIGRALRAEMRSRTGLALTVGIARTKVLAKMASRAGKPDGLLLVPPDRELEFLHPLAVESVWGVGAATARKLHTAGIRTVADLALMSEAAIATIAGPAMARNLYAMAQNRDRRRVAPRRGRRSFGSQSARRLTGAPIGEVDAVLSKLVERVTWRMRTKARAGRTVVLRLRFGDFTRATRSASLPQATASAAPILRVARRLLRAVWPAIERRGLTLVGISITGLSDSRAGVQLALPFAGERAELEAAVDAVRERFGSGAIKRATHLGMPERGHPLG